jgi:arginase
MTFMPKSIHTIGYASDIGANISGSAQGPLILKKSSAIHSSDINLNWDAILYSPTHAQGLEAIPAIAQINQELANLTFDFVKKKEGFLILGGDHTSAIGTWSGAAAALKGTLGLIWLDAHMDSHTPETTESNYVHGMPLAALLGFGDPLLTQIKTSKPKLLPEHVCLIGVRSFERGEAELLKKLQVRIFYIDEVKQRGIQAVMQEALTLVKTNTSGFGISLDLDVIDPTEAPGVSAPVNQGISGHELDKALTQINRNCRI